MSNIMSKEEMVFLENIIKKGVKYSQRTLSIWKRRGERLRSNQKNMSVTEAVLYMYDNPKLYNVVYINSERKKVLSELIYVELNQNNKEIEGEE